MANTGSFNTTAYDGRYLKFSWSVKSQNIANNATTIAWELVGAGSASVGYYKAGNFKVVIDGKTVYTSSTRINLYEGTLVASGTYTLTHNNAGARTFTASAQAGIYTVAVNCTGQGSFTLPTIPRASTITSVAGNKITDTFSVKFKKYVSTYTDTLQIAVNGKAVVQKITGYTSGQTFTLNAALKKDIYSASQTSQSATVAFQLVTYNGSTKVGTSDTITKSITVNDSQPALGDISYQDTNSKTTAITGDNQAIVRGYSTVEVTLTNLKAFNSASLTNLNVNAGDFSQDYTLSGATIATKTVSLGTLNLATDTVLTAVITDSRGHTAKSSITLNVCDYAKPQAQITCKRRENFYSETDLTVYPIISSINGKNTATITAQYKEIDATSYSKAQTIPNGEVSTLNLYNKKAWNVKVSVKDKLNTKIYVLFVEKGQPIIFFDREKSSVGVNCFPKDDESLEVLGKNIYKALYYQVGDTVAVSDIYCAGSTTSSNTKLYFSIPLSKSLDDVKSIALTEMKLNVRHGNGGYTLSNEYVTGGYDVLSDSSITVTYDIKTGANMVTFILSKTSAYNGVNNTPETVQVHSIKFTCK